MKFVICGLLLALSGFTCGFAYLLDTSRIDGFNIPFPHANIQIPQIPLRHFGLALPGAGFSIPRSQVQPSPRVPEPELELEPEPMNREDTYALIRAAAEKHRVPEALIKSIVAAESNFDCDAVSPKGAIGLMQLMPGTAQEYGADPSIPEQNVDAGTRYLRVLMDKYHRHDNSLKRVIAAYNAGPGKVDRYRGIPPFRETRGYVVRVLSFLRHFQREQG